MNLQSRKVYTFNTWHNNIHFCPQQNGKEKGTFFMSSTQIQKPTSTTKLFVHIFKFFL